jgi:DnaK suppressor protein
MEADRLEVFRVLLEERRQSLIDKSGQAIGELVGERDVMSDSTDIASEESDRDLALRMHDHDRSVMRDIEAALVRIRRGEYGECMACGDDITERRLLARPMATHCIDCMTELEATQRRAPAPSQSSED